jgi:hypothetical protein
MIRHEIPAIALKRTVNLIKALDGPTAVAKFFGVTHSAVAQWYTRGVPSDRLPKLLALASRKGYTYRPAQLRPDLY